MSSSANEQSEPSGSRSQEHAPRVVVRAGKTFVCSSCGTMVEIPADVVGQLVLAVEQTSHEKPVVESPARKESARSESAQSEPAPQSPSRSQGPPRRKLVKFTGQFIDGLRVPSAVELDRAISWVTFHLTVLDRQGSEVKRLRKLLKKQKVPCAPPPGQAKTTTTKTDVGRDPRAKQGHAYEDMPRAPQPNKPKGREPP